MKNYLNYNYIVVYYDVNGNISKRSYFSDLKSANDFYAKCKQKLKFQAKGGLDESKAYQYDLPIDLLCLRSGIGIRSKNNTRRAGSCKILPL